VNDSTPVISATAVLALTALTAWAMTRFLRWRGDLRAPRRLERREGVGRKVGDEITWRVPSGLRRLRLDEVLYQPERDGKDID